VGAGQRFTDVSLSDVRGTLLTVQRTASRTAAPRSSHRQEGIVPTLTLLWRGARLADIDIEPMLQRAAAFIRKWDGHCTEARLDAVGLHWPAGRCHAVADCHHTGHDTRILVRHSGITGHFAARKPTPKLSVQRTACDDKRLAVSGWRSERAVGRGMRVACERGAGQVARAPGSQATAWHASADASGRWWCPRAQARFAVAPQDCRAQRC